MKYRIYIQIHFTVKEKAIAFLEFSHEDEVIMKVIYSGYVFTV